MTSSHGETPIATDHVVIPGAWTFEPGAAQVVAGTNVTFANHGGAAHTVTFDALPIDATIEPGGEATFAFDTPGTYAYHCKFHPPDMKGIIIVQQGDVSPSASSTNSSETASPSQ